MSKGLGTTILVEAIEHLEENFLLEVLLGHPPGQVGADDAGNQRPEVGNQRPGGVLVIRPHGGEAGSHVKGIGPGSFPLGGESSRG